MDFARQQRDPTRHVIGITFVIVLHVIVIYALVTGLARKAIEVIKKPLTATIVEEIKAPPPPPPPPKKIEIPKTPPPPQVYVPPPDVPVPTTPSEPVIAQVTPTPPPAPVAITPPAPPAPAPKPAFRKITGQRIAGENPDYPPAARRKEVEGLVVAHLSIDEKGNVTDVKIVKTPAPRLFDAVIPVLMQWKFAPEPDKWVGELEMNFKLE